MRELDKDNLGRFWTAVLANGRGPANVSGFINRKTLAIVLWHTLPERRDKIEWIGNARDQHRVINEGPDRWVHIRRYVPTEQYGRLSKKSCLRFATPGTQSRPGTVTPDRAFTAASQPAPPCWLRRVLNLNRYASTLGRTPAAWSVTPNPPERSAN